MDSLAKLERATQMLAEAKTMDDILHVADLAEAAKAYARAAKLGLDAQNKAAEIAILARRKAGEYLAKLERNEHKINQYNAAPNVGSSTSEYSATLQESGISTQDASRWMQVASVPEDQFQEYIEETKQAGKEITTSAVVKLAKDYKNVHVANNSGNNEWYTPKEYIDAARIVMGAIDIDPASNDKANETVKAIQFYTVETNGLDKSWNGKVWMNPPYEAGLIDKFCDKLAEEIKVGNVSESIVLVNNATETKWFDTLITYASAVVFTKGRVRFVKFDGTSGAPLQGQSILYFGKNYNKFLEVFNKFGWGAIIWK